VGRKASENEEAAMSAVTKWSASKVRGRERESVCVLCCVVFWCVVDWLIGRLAGVAKSAQQGPKPGQSIETQTHSPTCV
jgi:hypothetical protein